MNKIKAHINRQSKNILFLLICLCAFLFTNPLFAQDDITEGGITNTKNGITRTDVVLDFTLPENPVFEYNPETGEVIVYDTGGNPHTVDVPKNEEGKLR